MKLKSWIEDHWQGAEMSIAADEARLGKRYGPIGRYALKVAITFETMRGEARYRRCKRKGHRWIVPQAGSEMLVCSRCGETKGPPRSDRI